jgi:hypothetical protein
MCRDVVKFEILQQNDRKSRHVRIFMFGEIWHQVTEKM